MKRYGVTDGAEVMLVWLHGDVSAGGPATYHFALAEKAVADLKPAKVLSVALVRPGYPGENGEASTGNAYGRADNYTLDNVKGVGAAIGRLQQHYKPGKVIVIGHSGGAATTAILLGAKPRIMHGAILAACPCDLVSWRAGRRQWGRSEDPMRWTSKVEPGVTVLAFTGSKDDNTSPDLAKRYVEALAARGIKASFELVPDASHNSVLRSQAVADAIASLVRY